MHRPRKITWGRVAMVAVVAVCVAYAPIAMTDLWPYAHPGAPAFGNWVMSHMVSPHYVADVVVNRLGPYRHSLIPLIVHSVLGGALMLLGPVQLLSAVRRRIRLHRAMGVVFALTVYVSMAGAAVYLARTAPADAFSGAVFWIVLATILVGTVTSVTFGIAAAVRALPGLHRRWMLLCYGFLMTAPLLRLEWGGLPWLLPGLTMAEINRIAIMHLGSVVAFGALVAARALDRREPPAPAEQSAAAARTWVPLPVLAVAHVAGAVALVLIARAFVEWGVQGRRLLGGYLVPYGAAYVIMLVCQWRAGRAGRTWAREEWRLHLAALCLAPVFSALAALAFERYPGLDHETALCAGVSVGCGMLAFAATAAVSLRVLAPGARVRSGPPRPVVREASSG